MVVIHWNTLLQLISLIGGLIGTTSDDCHY
jgi:hypothetical protein